MCIENIFGVRVPQKVKEQLKNKKGIKSQIAKNYLANRKI